MENYQTRIFGVVLAAMLLTPLLAQQTQLPQPRRIRSAEDLINNWNAEQHLYVKGDLGIGPAQFSNLEQWLDENALHWTVVLFDQSGDEVYRSLDGRSFRGVDAVEYALGRGLALRTNFSELIDPRTGETDGAVFVLFLQEREFSYYASVAQDMRSLGESHWVGELDRPAFRAMSGGGRILDAVRDTVSNVNNRLTQKINAEVEQAERQRRSRQRALVNLRTDIGALRQSVEQTATKAVELKSAQPNATGDLTAPPAASWRRRLAELEGNLTEDNIAPTKSQFNEISHEVEGFLNAYAEYDTLDTALAPLESAIDALQSNEISAGRPMADEAAKHVEAAKTARSQGDRGLSEFLSKAQAAIQSGQQAISNEQARIARADARSRIIRRTALATAALFLLAFVGILVWLNRRRVPAKNRAQKAFSQQQQSVKAEMDRVYQLFESSHEILGSKENVHQRGYTGTTERLTGNTFEDIDDLFVMSSEVQRVMDEARDMIYPKGWTGSIANLFSGSRFERGVNRISGEPLTFHRDTGLPLVIRRESEMLGEEPPEEVTMTFEKVFEAFHERTGNAERTLDTIENSLLHVDDDLRTLQDRIEAVTNTDRELAAAAEGDGFLALPSLFETLIPSTQVDFDKADELAGEDPVQAIQEHISRGQRKMTEATQIADTVQQIRKQIFPQLNTFAPQLRELGYDTDWMQKVVGELGERANRLLAEAADRSIDEDADAVAADVTRFGQRVEATLNLVNELEQADAPRLHELAGNIAAARQQIASALNVPEVQCLEEHEASPDVHLASARDLFGAAKAALQLGGTEAAAQAQSKLRQEVEAGQQLIDQTTTALADFENTLRERRQQLDYVNEKVPRHEKLLDGVRDDFLPAALVLQAGDPTYEDPGATVDTQLAQCRDALRDATRLVGEAAKTHREAKILRAENMLRQGHEAITAADAWLVEIDQHCSRLQEVSRENEGQLARLEREAVDLRAKIDDRRTMRPTVSEFERLLQELDAAQREIENTRPRDPFRDKASMDAFAEQLAQLLAKIDADHDAHAEAARAIASVKGERNLAEQLVHRARTDNIPDSAATTSSIRSISSYDQAIRQLEQDLNTAHHDWQSVNHAATRLHSELGLEAGRLRGELDRAQQLMNVFQSASDAVFEATRWTGGFGSRIFGSPGSAELERARGALNMGDYVAMAELARVAQTAARHAIQKAQREVDRKRREAARRAEEARRRRRRNSMSIGGGGGISFPSSGSRSSSSKGRSSSGSSGSSGSGFSRSGW